MRIKTDHIADVDLKGGRIVSFSGGWDEWLYVLIRAEPSPANGIEGQTSCDWRILRLGKNGASEWAIKSEGRDFGLAQPMPGGILLASYRCRNAGVDTVPNACIFDLAGHLQKTMLLGDGIHRLQTTESGDVWVGYHDEGVYGNFGWGDTKGSVQPIGRSGLVRFDATGSKTFEFEPVQGLGCIDDCYALNVVSNDEVYCCYYSHFPIVRIASGKIDRFWTNGVAGAGNFAILENHIVIAGGYGEENWKKLTLGPEKGAAIEGAIEFESPSGEHLTNKIASARGRLIWFLSRGSVYRFDLKSLND